MQDFRESLRPVVSPSRESVSEYLACGDLVRAVKMCMRTGFDIKDFPNDIQLGVRRLLRENQPGYILSFIYKYKIDVKYSIDFLLNKMLEVGDNETNFLKQVHRFRYGNLFQLEVEQAIQRLIKKGQTGSAGAWKRKMREVQGIEPLNHGPDQATTG